MISRQSKNNIIIFTFFWIIIAIIFGVKYQNYKKENFSYEREVPLPVEIVSTSTPIKVRIPKIEVDADIEKVGITKKGNMSVPYKSNNVGWYRYGPVPGMIGSAVFAGHVDNINGKLLVFGKLNELETGDDIYVQNEEGDELHFKVIDKKVFDYNSEITKEIFFKADDAYLNLITCDGAWIQSEKSYENRLVVYSKLVI